jgi:hypothetical protein
MLLDNSLRREPSVARPPRRSSPYGVDPQIEDPPIAREVRAARLAACASSSFDARRPLVADGFSYPLTKFEGELALVDDDPFLDALTSATSLEVDVAFPGVHAAVATLMSTFGLVHAFKFGITRGPSLRFHRRDYGYFTQGYDRMLVIHAGPPQHCGEVERQLIARHRSIIGCQNFAPGGESLPPAGVATFVYVVVANLVDGRGLAQRAAQRDAESTARSRDRLRIAYDTQID